MGNCLSVGSPDSDPVNHSSRKGAYRASDETPHVARHDPRTAIAAVSAVKPHASDATLPSTTGQATSCAASTVSTKMEGQGIAAQQTPAAADMRSTGIVQRAMTCDPAQLAARHDAAHAQTQHKLNSLMCLSAAEITPPSHPTAPTAQTPPRARSNPEAPAPPNSTGMASSGHAAAGSLLAVGFTSGNKARPPFSPAILAQRSVSQSPLVRLLQGTSSGQLRAPLPPGSHSIQSIVPPAGLHAPGSGPPSQHTPSASQLLNSHFSGLDTGSHMQQGPAGMGTTVSHMDTLACLFNIDGEDHAVGSGANASRTGAGEMLPTEQGSLMGSTASATASRPGSVRTASHPNIAPVMGSPLAMIAPGSRAPRIVGSPIAAIVNAAMSVRQMYEDGLLPSITGSTRFGGTAVDWGSTGSTVGRQYSRVAVQGALVTRMGSVTSARPASHINSQNMLPELVQQFAAVKSHSVTAAGHTSGSNVVAGSRLLSISARPGAGHTFSPAVMASLSGRYARQYSSGTDGTPGSTAHGSHASQLVCKRAHSATNGTGSVCAGIQPCVHQAQPAAGPKHIEELFPM